MKKGTDNKELLRIGILLFIITISAFNLKNSYNEIYGILDTDKEFYTPELELYNLDINKDYATKSDLVNGLIEALNVVISLLCMIMCFQRMINKYNISLIDEFKNG